MPDEDNPRLIDLHRMDIVQDQEDSESRVYDPTEFKFEGTF